MLHVLKSQPPRAHDIPDLVGFVQHYGGLPTGFFVKELNDLVVTIPSERVASGQFFKWLTDLHKQFPAHQISSHFVNAVVFAHVRADTNIQDGICRYITKADITSLGSKRISPRSWKPKRY